jgi:hypothetical protein
LEVCTDDDQPAACWRTPMGANASQWAAEPLSAFDEPSLTANASQYEVGDVAGLTFQNPWPGASALLVWANVNSAALRTKLFPTVPQVGAQADVCCVKLVHSGTQKLSCCPGFRCSCKEAEARCIALRQSE